MTLGLLAAVTGAFALPSPPLPIAYWPLDEAAGTTSADVIGGNNGAWNGGPLPLAAPLPPLSTNSPASRALTFDGTGNKYVEVANTPALENVQEQSYSLSAWCRPADLPAGTGAAYNASYALIIKAGYHEGLKYNSNGSFSFDHWATGNVYAGTGGGSFAPGSWYHVVAVWDRSAGQARMYVNGGLISSAAATLDNRDFAQNPWRIGIAYQGTGNYTWPMKGDIDDVRIYDYALDATQIAVLAAGTPTPTNLVATSGLGQVALTWNAPPGAGTYTYSVYASTTANPPNWGAPVATGLTTTSYTHATGTPNILTYYTVTATSCATSGYCTPAGGTNYTPITANPPTGLQTNENGSQAVFNLTFNLPLPSGSSVTITITSSNGAEGQVSANGYPRSAQIVYGPIHGPVAPGSQVPITVTGIDDLFADGPQKYHITVTTASGDAMFHNLNIPPIDCVNNDNDTPGVTFSRTTGLATSETGASDSFTVVLNTRPTNDVTLDLTSSNLLEGTVAPSRLTFRAAPGTPYNALTGIGSWDQAHTVTVTGVDDALLDFTVPYQIRSAPLVSSDPNYDHLVPPAVDCINYDDEVPPPLEPVWGNAGCGLLGAEAGVLLAIAALLRRRP